MKYYHNPNCGTSKKGLEWLRQNGYEPEVRLYMKNPLDSQEIEKLLKKLGKSAGEIVRKKGNVYNEKFSSLPADSEEWSQILAENPSLIERPILEVGEKAVIGRPIENFLTLIA